MRSVKYVVVFLVIAMIGSVSQAENLINNGYFEAASGGWVYASGTETGGNVTKVTNSAAQSAFSTGSSGAYMTDGTVNQGQYLQNNIGTAQADGQYLFSFDYKIAASASSYWNFMLKDSASLFNGRIGGDYLTLGVDTTNQTTVATGLVAEVWYHVELKLDTVTDKIMSGSITEFGGATQTWGEMDAFETTNRIKLVTFVDGSGAGQAPSIYIDNVSLTSLLPATGYFFDWLLRGPAYAHGISMNPADVPTNDPPILDSEFDHHSGFYFPTNTSYQESYDYFTDPSRGYIPMGFLNEYQGNHTYYTGYKINTSLPPTNGSYEGMWTIASWQGWMNACMVMGTAAPLSGQPDYNTRTTTVLYSNSCIITTAVTSVTGGDSGTSITTNYSGGTTAERNLKKRTSTNVAKHEYNPLEILRWRHARALRLHGGRDGAAFHASEKSFRSRASRVSARRRRDSRPARLPQLGSLFFLNSLRTKGVS
jgi:hypothetical protein